MKKLLFLCVALLVVPASTAFAQLDLSWDNCITAAVGEPPPTTDKTFDCTASKTYRLHGSYKVPAQIPDFIAMDISLDLQTAAAAPLPLFYHYESGGCNNSGAAFSADKSTAGATGQGDGCSGFNTAWGETGTDAAFANFTAYAPDFGQPGRGRFFASIARSSASPIALQPQPKNYYGFHIRFLTANRVACTGCGTPAVIVWNSATMFSVNSGTTVLSGPSPKSTQYCATIQAAGLSTCAATPSRNTTWGQLKSIYR